MKKLLLIGANGQLGADIYHVFKHSYKITPLTHRNLDITDFLKTKKVIEKIKPNIVINTAAYHKVDEVEDFPQKAFLINAIAQRDLSAITKKINAAIVFFSTDYVFGMDIKRNTPYKETDNVGPVNTYGVSKAAGEFFTRTTNPNHFIIRTSGLYGAKGTHGKENFVDLMLRLGKERGQVNVVGDQVITPTYTLNLAENLLKLLKVKKFGTYHMTSEGQCSWWEFTSEIFKLAKLKVKCSKVSSSFFNTKAQRPNYSVLENFNLKIMNINQMNHWKINLRLYLEEKNLI